MLALRVLGGFQVVRDGREVSELTAQPGRAALLVFLALEGSTTRDAVVALLWPEHDAQKARHALSQTLHRLRGMLGEEWLETEGERLAVAADVDVDARAFETFVDAGQHERALPLYHGDFLPGWFLAETPAFELWVDRQRAHLERLHRHARREWIRGRLERGDVPAALRAAQEWAEIDPLEDEAQHRLIELLAESGRRAEALRQYELYRRLLEKESLAPLDETVELVTRLRQAADVGPLGGGDEDDRRPAAPAHGAVPPSGPEVVPAPVAGAEGAPAPPPGAAPDPVPAASPLGRVRTTLRARLRSRAAQAVLAGAALALVALGWTAFSRLRASRTALSATGRVVLADFDNDTRDTLIAAVVTEALRIDLQRHLRSGLLGQTEIARELARMRRPTSSLSEETARELAIRAGIPVVVGGRVGKVGPGFVLSGWIVAAPSGRILNAALATARDSSELIDAIENLSRQLRNIVRPSLASLPASAPLARVSTSSLEALRRYSAAVRLRRQEGNNAHVVRLLQEAVSLDTTFAMANRALGMMLLNMRAPRRAWLDALKAAYRHRDRLSEDERYLTIAGYHQFVTGQTEEAIHAYESLLDLDSAQLSALNNLAVVHLEFREYPRAEGLLRRCVAADSLEFACEMNLASVVHAQGRSDEARAIVERTIRHFPNYRRARQHLVAIAAANQDYARADSLLGALGPDNPAGVSGYQRQLAHLDIARGRVTEGRQHLRESYRAAGRGAPADAYAALVEVAWLELLIRRDTARALAAMYEAQRDSSLLALDSVEVPYLGIADFFLAAGRPEAAAAALRAYLARVPPELRSAQDRVLFSIRGVMAMQRGRLEEAAEAFRVADTLPGSAVEVLQYLGPFHERAGRPDSAIAAYERYLTAGSLDRADLDAFLLADVLERLAVLNERAGRRLVAARYYTRLATLWADADAELQPRVAEARRRALLLRQAPAGEGT